MSISLFAILETLLKTASKSPICDENFGRTFNNTFATMAIDYLKDKSLDDIIKDVGFIRGILSDETEFKSESICIALSPAYVMAEPFIQKELKELKSLSATSPSYVQIQQIIKRRTEEAELFLLKEKFFKVMTVLLESELDKRHGSSLRTAKEILQLVSEKMAIKEELERVWSFYFDKVKHLPIDLQKDEMEKHVKELISKFG